MITLRQKITVYIPERDTRPPSSNPLSTQHLFIPASFNNFSLTLTHALFMALLFLCAGVINHKIRISQDVCFMVICRFKCLSLLLCLSCLAGFHSRDLILQAVSFSYVTLVGFSLLFASTDLELSI
jgi:hypothetical protein